MLHPEAAIGAPPLTIELPQTEFGIKVFNVGRVPLIKVILTALAIEITSRGSYSIARKKTHVAFSVPAREYPAFLQAIVHAAIVTGPDKLISLGSVRPLTLSLGEMNQRSYWGTRSYE